MMESYSQGWMELGVRETFVGVEDIPRKFIAHPRFSLKSQEALVTFPLQPD